MYRAARGVSWVTHDNGILIIDEVARRSELLAYPEAAVWDMACRGHDTAYIEINLRWIMGNDWMPDNDIVRENLGRWVKDVLLEPDNSSEEVI